MHAELLTPQLDRPPGSRRPDHLTTKEHDMPRLTISACPAGRRADGGPLPAQRFTLARPVIEPFGENRSRIFVAVWIPKLHRYDTHPVVVLTDTIREVEPDPDQEEADRLGYASPEAYRAAPGRSPVAYAEDRPKGRQHELQTAWPRLLPDGTVVIDYAADSRLDDRGTCLQMSRENALELARLIQALLPVPETPAARRLRLQIEADQLRTASREAREFLAAERPSLTEAQIESQRRISREATDRLCEIHAELVTIQLAADDAAEYRREQGE